MTIPTPIYHFTHMDNIPSILENGAFHCCRGMHQDGKSYRNIAYGDLQDRRATTSVRIDPFGTLHDYVPFYFAPRSPMLYAINRGIVAGYQDGQSQIVYFVSNAQRCSEIALPFVFTDGHGIMKWTNYYNDLTDLNKIDWGVMTSQYWNDTTAQPDRKRKRQAEFLIHNEAPLHLFAEIVVINSVKKVQVEQRLASAGIDIPVNVQRGWYY